MSDTPTHSARDQLFLDLFTTALEGGINYWATANSYHWLMADGSEDVMGFYADIVEDGEGELRVDRSVIAKGYGLATGTHRDTFYWSSGEKPPLVVTDDTDWDFDASDADAIVQLGLFGAVVYG